MIATGNPQESANTTLLYRLWPQDRRRQTPGSARIGTPRRPPATPTDRHTGPHGAIYPSCATTAPPRPTLAPARPYGGFGPGHSRRPGPPVLGLNTGSRAARDIAQICARSARRPSRPRRTPGSPAAAATSRFPYPGLRRDPAHVAGPVAVPVDHAGRTPAPGAPILAHSPLGHTRLPCAFSGRRPNRGHPSRA